jgi:hypothetical protein
MGPEGAIARFLKSIAQEDARLCKKQLKTGQEVKKKETKEKQEGVSCHVGYAAGRDR